LRRLTVSTTFSTSLASADLSIAMGNGTDIAIDVAKVTILNSDLNKISDLIKISKDTPLVSMLI
jgi:Cu2+-exporting ATPase